ncbi:amidohydrolase family protein [Kribbella sp. NPDC050470]
MENHKDPATHRLLLRGGTVLSMDPAVGDFAPGDVLIEGTRIKAVGPRIDLDAPAMDCTGRIVMPGFVNSHHHMFQTALRGYWSDALAVDYFTQSRQGENAIFHHYSPGDVYWGQYAGALEQLNAGTTTVVDTSQCTYTPEHTDAAVEALRESGLRCVYAYSATSGSAVPHPQSRHPLDVSRLRQAVFGSDDQLVTLALGTPVNRANWQLARELDLPIFSHVNDEAAGLQVEELARQGLAGPWNTYIHCTGLASSTWQVIAATDGKASLSNLVEQTLCTGMPGMQAALDHGVQPSFSTDAVSLGPTDFFTQMRAAYALQRSRLQEKAVRGTVDSRRISTRDVLRMATIEGARAAHLDHRVGSLTPGKEADVIVLNGGLINAAPVNQATGAVVMMMDTSNVESVLIGGRPVKQDGRLLDVDVPAVVRAVEASAEGLIARSGYPDLLLGSCRN